MTKRNEWYGKRVSDKGSAWKPEIGERYWVIGLGYFTIFSTVNENVPYDKLCIKLRNCFRTKREDQAALRRVKKALRNE